MSSLLSPRHTSCALLLALLVFGECSVAQALGVATRIPLTPTVVASVLAGAGLPVDPKELEIPADLSIRNAESRLRITGAELLSDARIRVKLACESVGDCQPFLVIVHSQSTEQGLSGLAKLQKAVDTDPRTRISLPGRLQAGQRATFVLEDSQMLISMPVVLIDTGGPGVEVRVSTLDRKQTFRGVVSRSGVVRGSLQ
jgi:hypothetical protein